MKERRVGSVFSDINSYHLSIHIAIITFIYFFLQNLSDQLIEAKNIWKWKWMNWTKIIFHKVYLIAMLDVKKPSKIVKL